MTESVPPTALPQPQSPPQADPAPGVTAAAAAGAAQRGRSPSGAAPAAAAGSPVEPVPGAAAAPPQLPADAGDAAVNGASLPGLALGGTVRRRNRNRRLVAPGQAAAPLTAEQRLLLLDTWQRSGLPAADFAPLVGVSKHTLYSWKQRFEQHGPAGLLDQPKGARPGSHLPELTKRTILLLKQAHPDYGCQKISDLLLRGPALPASPGAVARVLHEAGYETEETPTRPHAEPVRRFERARPNQLWQTDLFTFVLKRQNCRVYLVAFMDDHSRFVVGYGLHASQSTALVLEVLRAALAGHGTPEEVLTDNGSQYVTWRGKSAFTRELEKRGIHQVVASPRRPQTLGKIERFWGSLWRECLEAAVFLDLGDARRRIGLFIDHYNFQRPHQGIEGLVPADRFFGAAPQVHQTLKARVAANALELARNGLPKPPFYLTGQVGDRPFSLHAEGERVILTGAEGRRQEIDLVPPAAPVESTPAWPEPVCPAGVVAGPEPSDAEPPPGTSPLDDLLPPGTLAPDAPSGAAGEGGRP